VFFVVALAFFASLSIRLDQYSITPGYAQPVGPLITVSGHPHDVARRSILLTDVYLTQLTVWQWIVAKLHPVHEQIISGAELTDPGVPTSELIAQGYLEMYDSQNSAKVAAMDALGYGVSGEHAGATVTGVGSASPNFGTLSVADRIVGARGHTVTDVCSLLTALSGATPGRPVSLQVERASISGSGAIHYAAPAAVSAATAQVPSAAPPTGCPGAPKRSVWLGVSLEDSLQWQFPVDVSINTANIGGPSAGLAMTLGVIDALSKGSLTGHRRIAATGTIDPSGNVGDVGGVAEKTIAVEQAGATVFLVPPQELAVARSAASGGLKVIAVSTLSQALAAIERLGGTAPSPITSPTSSASRS